MTEKGTKTSREIMESYDTSLCETCRLRGWCRGENQIVSIRMANMDTDLGRVGVDLELTVNREEALELVDNLKKRGCLRGEQLTKMVAEGGFPEYEREFVRELSKEDRAGL